MSTKKKSNDSRKKLPDPIISHFKNAVATHEKLIHVIEISERGISVLRGMPKIVKVIADVEGSLSDPKTQKKLERAEKEAQLAISEVDKDFPVLHSFAVVALWSWLEHYVKGMVALIIMSHKPAMNSPALQKLRIRLGEYLKLSKDQQSKYVVELLEQELASALKQGNNRFEALLEVVGLSGSVTEDMSKTIFELQQVRNAVAHNNSLADKKLISKCPWLKLKQNDQIIINRDMLHRYSVESVNYALEIFYRVGDLYKLNIRPAQT